MQLYPAGSRYLIATLALALTCCSSSRRCPDGGDFLGACCRSANDCPPELECFTQVPEGLCSRTCRSRSDCPPEAYCIRIVSSSAGDLGMLCLAGCSEQQPCPGGLDCRVANEAENIRVCFPDI